MSEELAKLASHFYDKYDGDCDFEAKRCVVDFAVEFAAQVCEQREKEAEERFTNHYFQDEGIAPDGELRPLVSKLLRRCEQQDSELLKRAELALQTQTIEVTPLRLAVLKNEETIVLLQTALQTKEQELRCKEGHELFNNGSCVICILESELAQARQQAVAECARIVFDEGYEAVAHRLRSLTPPPALTPTCIGYEGGCDGNLTGEPHEANCPKFAPPSQKEKP